MSYTFRVLFEGVCAYVPEKPFFAGEKPQSGIDSMCVLLPDLRRPGVVPPYPNTPRLPSLREPHFPLIKFRLSDLREGTTRRVDLVCRDIGQSDEHGHLFLRREQIRFKLDAENANAFSFAAWTPANIPPERRKDNPRLEECPDPSNRDQLESLWWLPDLALITNNNEASRPRPETLPSFRGPFPEGLVARVECNGGRFRTFNFNRGTDGNPIRWRFADPEKPEGKGSWNRVLSNVLALEFFDVRSEVRIELKRLANEVITEELVLAPGPGASRPLLEIGISNREPGLLFQDEGFSRATLPDMDFQAFYERLSSVAVDVWKNLPVPHPGRMTFFGLVEKPCTGGLMIGGTP